MKTFEKRPFVKIGADYSNGEHVDYMINGMEKIREADEIPDERCRRIAVAKAFLYSSDFKTLMQDVGARRRKSGVSVLEFRVEDENGKRLYPAW